MDMRIKHLEKEIELSESIITNFKRENGQLKEDLQNVKKEQLRLKAVI